MRRIAIPLALLILAGAGACNRDIAPPAATTTTTTVAPTTSTAPTTTTTTATAPATDPTPGSAWAVVLVLADDVLNLRVAPGTTAQVVARLRPQESNLVATGRTADVDGARWWEVTAPGHRGWVNAFYLTPRIEHATFAADSRVDALLARLAAALTARADLTPVTSRRGLYVAHFDPLRRFRPDALVGLAADPTLRDFGGGGCSPGECPRMTFARAVGDSFVGAFDDPDRQLTTDTPIGGGNAALPETVVPAELQNLNYRAVYDPGDNPAYGGLDWTTWYVFFDYEQGEPVVVAMVYDAWVP